MTHRLISLLLILTASCNTRTANWRTLDFGAFKLKAPDGWKIIKEQGIDSYYGGLTDGKDSLWFDYGRYEVDLNSEENYKQRLANDTVNGFSASVMIPDTVGKGYISMYIPKVTDEMKFTIWGSNIQQTDTILKIYKSIVFKNSDTSNNPLLTNAKFTSITHGSGKTLFIENCASCHSMNRDLTGPALTNIVEYKTHDWLYSFLTNRKAVPKDSLYHDLTNRYRPLRCLDFSSLTEGDISVIVNYIKDK